MFTHEATIDVPTSPRTAFAFLADPTNQVTLTPGLIDLTSIAPVDGFALRYRYEIAGVTLSGRLRDTIRRPPTRLVRAMSGALEGSFRYRLQETTDGTTITLGTAVRLPSAVTESIGADVAATAIEQDVTATLETLQSSLG